MWGVDLHRQVLCVELARSIALDEQRDVASNGNVLFRFMPRRLNRHKGVEAAEDATGFVVDLSGGKSMDGPEKPDFGIGT